MDDQEYEYDLLDEEPRMVIEENDISEFLKTLSQDPNILGIVLFDGHALLDSDRSLYYNSYNNNNPSMIDAR